MIYQQTIGSDDSSSFARRQKVSLMLNKRRNKTVFKLMAVQPLFAPNNSLSTGPTKFNQLLLHDIIRSSSLQNLPLNWDKRTKYRTETRLRLTHIHTNVLDNFSGPEFLKVDIKFTIIQRNLNVFFNYFQISQINERISDNDNNITVVKLISYQIFMAPSL